MKGKLVICLFVTLFAATAALAQKPESKPVEQKDAKPAVTNILNQVETLQLQLLTEKLNHENDKMNALRTEAQFLHDQICNAHETAPAICSFSQDLRSIVKPAIAPQKPVVAPQAKKEEPKKPK